MYFRLYFRYVLLQIPNFAAGIIIVMIRRILPRIFAVVLFTAFIVCPYDSMAKLSMDDNQDIPIRPVKDDNPVQRPHSLDVLPLRAYYDSMSSSIVVVFSKNIGDVEIEVYNYSTGNIQNVMVASDSGSVVIQDVYDEGYYQIRFTVDSVLRYLGVFVL